MTICYYDNYNDLSQDYPLSRKIDSAYIELHCGHYNEQNDVCYNIITDARSLYKCKY